MSTVRKADKRVWVCTICGSCNFKWNSFLKHRQHCHGDDEIDNDRLEFSEDIELYVNERAVLLYRIKFMRWGMAGAGSETMNGKATSYNTAQAVTLQFLQTLETGEPLSLQRQQGILNNARRMGGSSFAFGPRHQ